jgi:hemoglobin/transferrin/lactoferrin receptor protein
MNKIILVLASFQCLYLHVMAQEKNKKDSIQNLETIIVSFNKWEQNLNEVPNKIVGLNMKESRLRNPQTTADLLSSSGAVFVQKSQLGGGSPMIRGFATNRVLIVSDGVRMNNAIFRSGNIQNVISIDPLALEEAEVIFGPGSLIYGSDAIGGVMDFHTLEPRFAQGKKMLTRGSATARYSTANNERTVHADINLGWKKLSILSSLSSSNFDDQKMGSHGPASYLRPEFVQRINNKDSIVKNPDPAIQRFSGYDQFNLLQKIAYKISEKTELQYGFTYAGTGDVPRYDRLIQFRQGQLRFAEWYYGPMIWRMHQLQLKTEKSNAFYDESRFIVAFQDYGESRIERIRNSNNRTLQAEKVYVSTANWDATKTIGEAQLFYGVEGVYNKVGSTGSITDINSGNTVPFVSRYPDGSNTSSLAAYISYKKNLGEKVTFSTGIRFSQNELNATFDTTFIKFPYQKAELQQGLPIGSLGMVYRPKKTWQINGNISTGYRMPNIDDMGKFFESAPGLITVPNPDLRSEYAWNFEVGIAKRSFQHSNVELSAFYTVLNNAIVRRPYTFNGLDSISFGGITSAVEALQNIGNAKVWGLMIASEIYISKTLIWQLNANWIRGIETDDQKDVEVPLRHAPPFYANSNLRYTYRKFTAELGAFYNAEIRNADMPPSEQVKTHIYAKDENGKPYSPSWCTLNLKCSYKINEHFELNLGLENMTDQRYRPYSSGIVAAGANFIASIRAAF